MERVPLRVMGLCTFKQSSYRLNFFLMYSTEGSSASLSTFSIHWGAECSSSSYSDSPPVLQQSTEGFTESMVPGDQSYDQNSGAVYIGLERATCNLLADPCTCTSLEREDSSLKSDSNHYSVGCLIARMGSTKSGPICLQANPSAATIVQLETRHISKGSDAFQTRLEQCEGLCQSLLVSDRPGQGQTSSGDPGNPTLEESGLVSNNPGYTNGLLLTHFSLLQKGKSLFKKCAS